MLCFHSYLGESVASARGGEKLSSETVSRGGESSEKECKNQNS